jgi:hypothetical protein
LGGKITWKPAESNVMPSLLGHVAILLNYNARTKQKFASSINHGTQILMYVPLQVL